MRFTDDTVGVVKNDLLRQEVMDTVKRGDKYIDIARRAGFTRGKFVDTLSMKRRLGILPIPKRSWELDVTWQTHISANNAERIAKALN